MYCPICRSRLVLGEGTKLYFSGEEWAENSDTVSTEHEYYICSNHACATHDYVFWDFAGNYYLDGEKADELGKMYLSLHPFGSFCRKFQHSYCVDKKITILNFFIYKIILEYDHYDDDFGVEVIRRRKLCLYRRRLHGNYSEVDSIWNYLARNISQFRFEVSMLKEHPDHFTVKHFFSYYDLKNCCSVNSRLLSSWIVLRYSGLKKSVIKGSFFAN